MRAAVQLSVLAAAAFVYVTAEILPVGALPAIAADLRVSEAMVGTLLASYAFIAAVATVPLVRWTGHWPRRRTLLLTLVCLTVSQLISVVAPNFAVLSVARVLCALAHGLMWSVLAPIGVRLVPAAYAGRATTAVYAGTALALVLGNPVAAALAELFGWRVAVAAVAVGAAVVTLAARLVLPPLVLSTADVAAVRANRSHHRNRALTVLCALTVIGVTAHFISYTYIVVVIRDVVGAPGAQAAWVLAAFGVAGLIAMAAFAHPLDRWPKAATVIGLAGLALAFGALTLLASGAPLPLPLPTLAVGVAAIVLWGATSTSLPPMLQSAAMRSSPVDPDGASALYVAGFQVGIMAGALTGGLMYDDGGPAVMLGCSTGLAVLVLLAVLGTRGLFTPAPAALQGTSHS